MSERMFGQALLEGDTVNPNFFFMLAKENKKELRSCVVQIPPTVLFEQGFAKAIFATESVRNGTTGEVKKKLGRDVDPEDVYELMTKGMPDRSLCAVLVYAPPKSSELTAVRFLDKEGVKDFIFHELEKPKSLLQRYVIPKGSNNTLIYATWSPLLMLVEGRRCVHSLTDAHVDANRRGITFEDPNSASVNVVVSKSVVDGVTAMCETVSQHFEKSERLALTRMSAYFKVDSNSKVHLLYSTSLRFDTNGVQSNPVCLDLCVKICEEAKRTIVKTGSGILRGHDPLEAMDMALRDADMRIKDMRVTVPSIPDNTTLLLKGLRGHKTKPATPASSHGKTPPAGFSGCSPPSSPAKRPSVGFGADKPDAVSSPLRASKDVPQSPTAVAAPTATATNATAGPLSSAAGGGGAADDMLNPSTGESKYFTLSKGAALPQPRGLMGVQHLLPNSTTNLKTAMSTVSEEMIQVEWAKFLQLQNREVQKIRIRDAQRTAELEKAAAEEANRRSDHVDNGAAPPAKIHSTFDYRQPDKKRDDRSMCVDTANPAPGTANSEGRKSRSTQLTMLEVDPVVEQREFMTYLNQQVAKKMLEERERSDTLTAQQLLEADELEDDPRFVYLSRESKQRAHMPQEYSATKSTLLPPVFRSSHSGSKHSHAQSPQPHSKASSSKNSGGHKPSAATPEPMPSSGASSPGAARSKQPAAAAPAATPAVSAGPEPVESPPTPHRLSAVHGGNTTRHSFVGAYQAEDQTQAVALRKQAQAQAAVAKRSLSVAKLQEFLQIHRNEERRAHAKRDHCRELTDARCRVAKRFADFELSGAQVQEVYAEALALCAQFRQFMQDLVYSMHEVFLVGASSIYIEVPVEFADVVSVLTLAHILHKLHGKTVKRTQFLRSVCPSSLNGDLAQFRLDQLQLMQDFAIRGFSYEALTNAQLSEDATVDVLVVPLLPILGLNIVREESFAVLEDVQPFIDPGEDDEAHGCGLVFNNALKASYYKYLVGVKGAKAAMAAKQLSQAQERADREAQQQKATASPMLSTSKALQQNISSDAGGDDLAGSTHTPKTPMPQTTPPATPHVQGGASSSSSTAPPVAIKQTVSLGGVERSIGPLAPLRSAKDVEKEKQQQEVQKVDDIVCPRCNTCRVCCVCTLVYGKPNSSWKNKKK